MSIRLLILSRYSRLGASSRLRTLQYKPWLEQAGFVVDHAAFFEDSYLQALYSGSRQKFGVFRYYTRRVYDLITLARPDVIWLETEAFPWLPWTVERALWPREVKIVTDYDDAVFHRYDQHHNSVIRKMLGHKIDHVMKNSDLVLTGNDYLAKRAHDAGANAIKIVPTVVDLDRYPTEANETSDRQLRVGWIGTPETWAAFGRPVYDCLLPVLHDADARFVAIGGAMEPRTEGRLDLVPWSEETEVPRILELDVGVMPLPDTPWARGKCGYKLIQYMACALPVVAPPIGINTEIIKNNKNGYLVRSDREWRQGIKKLLDSKAQRSQFGAEGRKTVEREYSLQRWAPRIETIFRDLCAFPS